MVSNLKWRTGGEQVNFEDSMLKQQPKVTIVKQDIKNSNLIICNLNFISFKRTH
jgi:hypothetical protein